jgi:MHS family shikimate/dehydroshikimate transporter-like MFS transporter
MLSTCSYQAEGCSPPGKPVGENNNKGDVAMKQTSNPMVVFLATAIGSTFEQYDFLVYGTASALFFNKLFFPSFAPATGALAAIGVYAVGYCARPLGGVICGHFGDRIGRKSLLIVTFLIMGLSTTLIGCLPTYGSVGIWAPVSLVLLRFIQGLAIGGEHTGSGVFAVESAPPGQQGRYGTWPGMGQFAGVLLSSSAMSAAQAISGDDFLVWGWRLPFLISVLLLGLGTFLRAKLPESRAFRDVMLKHAVQRLPIGEVLRRYPGVTIRVMLCRIGEITCASVLTIVGAVYITGTLGLPQSTYLHAVQFGAVCALIALGVYGLIIDRVGRRTMYVTGAVLAALFAFPFFWLTGTKEPMLVFFAMAAGSVLGHVPMVGAQPSFFCGLFPTSIRYSGVAAGQQIGAAIGGGILPPVFFALLAWSHGSPWPIAVTLIFVTMVTAISALSAPAPRQVETEEALAEGQLENA